MTEPVLIDWNDDKRKDFRQGVVTARHRLHMDPAFSELALAALLNRHPRDLTDICTMGDDPTDRESWRAGEGGDLKGRELIEAVRSGKLWINLRQAMDTDPVYKPIFEALIGQLKRLNPGFSPLRAYGGILISSPRAQVFFHSDVSETLLLHVKGKKRFRIYPPRAPFVDEQSMEAILHKTQTEDVPFDPAWDQQAAQIDLDPGAFVSWPLHSPHRVENLEGLNVSITVEMVTPQSTLQNGVYHANGVLRQAGWTPRTASVRGVQAYAKLGLSKAFKAYQSAFGAHQASAPKSETTFDVDLAHKDGLTDRATA